MHLLSDLGSSFPVENVKKNAILPYLVFAQLIFFLRRKVLNLGKKTKVARIYILTYPYIVSRSSKAVN